MSSHALCTCRISAIIVGLVMLPAALRVSGVHAAGDAKADSADQFDALMESGAEAFRQAKFDDAVAHYKKAAELTKDTASQDGRCLRAAAELARTYFLKLDHTQGRITLSSHIALVQFKAPKDDPLSFAKLLLAKGDESWLGGPDNMEPWSSVARRTVAEQVGYDSAEMGLAYRQRGFALWHRRMRLAHDDAQKAVELLTKHLGKDHLETGIAIDLLGRVQHVNGDLSEALTSLEQARTVMAKHVDKAHTLLSFNDFFRALVLMDLGRFAEAMPLLTAVFEREHALLDPKQGRERIAYLRGHMGRCYEALEKWQEALYSYDVAYAFYRNLRSPVRYRPEPVQYVMIGRVRAALKVGKHEAALAKAMDALGEFRRWRAHDGADRNYQVFAPFVEAEQYEAAAKLGEKLMPKEPLGLREAEEQKPASDPDWKKTGQIHYISIEPRVGPLVMAEQLAHVHEKLGNPEKVTYYRAFAKTQLDVFVRVSKGDPAARHFIRALSQRYQGNFGEAMRHMERGVAARAAMERNIFAGGDSQARMDWLMRDAQHAHMVLCTAVRAMAMEDDEDAAGIALNTLLGFQAEDFIVAAEEMRIAGEASDEKLKAIATDLFDRRQRLGQLLLRERDPTLPERNAEAIAELGEEVAGLERQLAAQSHRIATLNAQRAVDWEQLAESLPEDAVFIGYVRNFDLIQQGTGLIQVWLAFTLRRDQRPTLTVLTDANDVNTHVHEFLSLLKAGGQWTGDAGAARHSVAAGVADWVLKPIWPHIKDARRWIIATDAVMTELPIGLLPQPHNPDRMAFEDYQISYVTTGKQIAGFGRPYTDRNDAVIVADPQFDRAPRPARQADLAPPRRETIPNAFADSSWSALPGTRKEALAIIKRLRAERFGLQTYVADRATPQAVLGVKSPRILHIATHGFFLPHSRMYLRPHPFYEEQRFRDEQGRIHDEPLKPLDGLLYSGLALAGANKDPSGLLTAYEMRGMDLRDTQVVVLSACDTALGAKTAGAAVRGLQNAVMQSGAHSLVMSQWKVPDQETAELMDLFYKHVLETDAPAEALRLAMLEMRDLLRSQGRNAAPNIWGAFVVTGDPGNWK